MDDTPITVKDLSSLAGQKFGTIYADPPWRYDNTSSNGSCENHYKTMSTDDIVGLPIESLAADNAHLHLWTTNAFIFDCKRIMEAWGFKYKSMFIWCKPQIGVGNYWRVSHELMLFGVRGSCPFSDSSQRSWCVMDRHEHSAKPNKIRRIIEKTSPAPRLELFGRRPANGWTVWGNQIAIDMFDGDVINI
jgi:N6-adenosine-specific RNA methylase IME4